MIGYETSMVQRTLRASGHARRLAFGAVVAGVMLLLSIAASPASAEFGITPGSFKVEALKADGTTLETQAGAHPNQAVATMRFNSVDRPGYMPFATDENVKDIEVTLPPGFLGNPEATAKCSRDVFDSVVTTYGICPPASQVGIVELETLIEGQLGSLTVPLYNVEPRAGETADFGMPVSVVAVHAVASVATTSDYGLVVKFTNVSQAIPILSARMTFWGVPADAGYDTQRSCFPAGIITGSPCPAGVALKPFLTNPSVCDGPLTTRARVNSWQNPTVFKSYESTTPVGLRGCEKQKFEASIDVQPDTRRAGAPAGYAVEIDVPQNDDPGGLATPPLKRAVVTLPEGVSISPSAADGLQGCSDAQIGIGSNTEPSCPDGSRVGTVKVTTPLLGEPMTGEIYQGSPLPGQMFRLFITMRGPGLLIKLAGKVTPDPVTGRITTTFEDNPPLPFSKLRLEFKGGPRAVLSNPPTCGTATTTAQFAGHGVATPSTSSSSFQVTRDGNGAPCPPRGFNPGFRAGSVNPVAGASSPFTMTFSRNDEDQPLGGVAVSMPEGLTGILASATLCGEAQAAAGTCGEESRIGSVTTASGPGSAPFRLPGRAYITGPYKGAPFGMSIVVPAVAGPFDLGTVVVRAAIHIDKTTTALRIVSDPLPTILEGVPLQVRSVNVRIDRRGFMLNPTSCGRKSVVGQVASILGAVADRSSRFQVGACKSLGYAPRLAFKIGAPKFLKAESTTPLAVTLTMPRGAQANNRSIEVTLPANVNSRLAALRGACSVEDARARRCGSQAIVGSAVAVTPLLRDPLRGPVYITRTVGNRLPDLWVALRGQGSASLVDVDLIGKVRIVGRRLQLRTTFGQIPDVPVSMFRLNFVAGRQAPIGLVKGICSARVARGMVAGLSMRAQSGKLVTRNQRMRVAGCARSAGAKRAARAGAR